jgi:hypothetical protein
MSSVLTTFTADASHELVEAITDPECGLDTGPAVGRPTGWFDPNQANQEGELGDICLTTGGFVPYLGYTVQSIWSERAKKCITNDPSLTLCDGKTRPCTPCAASDCSGSAPICDTDMKSDTWGQCITHTSSGGTGGSGSNGSSGSGSSGGSTGSGGGSTGSNSGSPGATGSSSSGGADGETPENGQQSSSGGCNTAGSWNTSPSLVLSLGAALVLIARRRKSRR